MKKLPILVESEIYLRTLEQPTLKTQTRILGGRHGDFILIEEPVFRMNDRLVIHADDFMCSIFHDGENYKFASKVQRPLGDGLVLIDYPARFEVEAIREFHRVQVNLETRFHIEKKADDFVECTMMDISQGGCFLSIPRLIPVTRNMACYVSFILPDRQLVAGVESKVRSVSYSKLKKITELGLQFLGPPEQIAKIAAFCNYCMFFKV